MSAMNRRVFLGSMAAAGAAQEKKLQLGLIGCGWYGGVDTKAALAAGGAQIAAICDVDSAHLDQTGAELEKQQGARPKAFKQYKELLEMDGLDGVIIATPPHWHALPFIDACRRKLPIYCEKPLAYDIREGQAMVDAWKKAGNIVQVGFQRRQSEAFRQAREFIAAGNIGKPVQVDVQIHYTAQPLDNTPQPPPQTLDWELWLGPAPKMPYSPNVAHRAWRLEENIGNGHLVDWGIHLIDATRQMLSLGAPRLVSAAGGIYHYKGRITTPDTLTAHFEFEQCPVVWRHRLWGSTEIDPAFSNGVFVYGEKGTVFATDARWIHFPKEKGAERKVTEFRPLPDLGMKHVAEWLEAIRQGRQPGCPPDDAFLSTSTVQLGMIAYKVGRAVQWDAASCRILNDPAAGKLLLRPYRAPYKHPFA
jgi:predicted dehydrogenase